MSLRDRKVDNLTTQNQDFHGRRITNAGDAVASQDYVTLSQLTASLADTTSSTNSTITVGAWIPLTLANSWVVSNVASYGTPAYRLVTLGNLNAICFRGQIKNGTITDGTTISTLSGLPSFLLTDTLVMSATAAFSAWKSAGIFLFNTGVLAVEGLPALTVYVNLSSIMVLST